MALQTLALFFLGTVAAGGIAWVFIYPILSGERQAEKRKELVAKPEQVTVTRVATQQRGTQKARREQVEDTLKELEVRQKNASAGRCRCGLPRPASNGRSASSS